MNFFWVIQPNTITSKPASANLVPAKSIKEGALSVSTAKSL